MLGEWGICMAAKGADIADWLQSIDLPQLAPVFEANDITRDILPELTEDDLRELGLSLGHRRRILGALQTLAAEDAGARAAAGVGPGSGGAERRQITVLFCDVVGSTEILHRLDPEDMLELRDAYHALCRKLVERHGGHIKEYLGDGVVAYFGHPWASEHDAVGAVRAGLALAAEAGSLSTPDDESLRVRVGVATGVAVLLDREAAPGAVGDVLNLAARLQGAATPGAVVIDFHTHRLVAHRFECAGHQALPLKGFDTPVAAWQVREEVFSEHTFAARIGQAQTPLVGRDAELETLRAYWRQARSGAGCVVCLEGDAGLGKSRLAGAFIREIEGDSTILKFFGAPDAEQTPLRPVIDQIAWSAGLATSEPAEDKLDKIEGMLERNGFDMQRLAPIYAELCGIPSGGRYRPLDQSPLRFKRTVFDTMIEVVAHMALQRPLLVFFEDLHWMDPTTLELIAELVRALRQWPVMALYTTRPEHWSPASEGQSVHRIALRRLDRGDAEALLRLEIERHQVFDPALVARVLDRADGVPLYIEEIARAMAGAELAEERDVPSTLHNALMARLDRLGPAKPVAQVAAVIGREFRPAMIAAVAQMAPAEVDAVLDRLVADNLLVRNRSRTDDGPVYRFRHALLRDAAYSSQLRRTRRATHAAIAAVLQRDFPLIAEQSPEELARHLAGAGESRAAAAQWRRVGLAALAGAHYAVAVEAYGKALDLLKEDGLKEGGADPAAELEILTELGTAQIAIMGFAAPAVGDTYARAEELARGLGTSAALARPLWGLWLYRLVRGELGHARALSEELADLAHTLGDEGLLLEAHWARGDTLFWQGHLADARDSLEAALALYDPATHRDHALLFGQDPSVAALCYLSYVLWAQGEEAAVQDAMRTALRRSRDLNHPFTTAWALTFATTISVWRGEARATLRLAGIALRHMEEQILPFWQSCVTIWHGWARVRLGDVEGGLAEARGGLAQYDLTGSETVQPMFRGILAECLADVGLHDEAAVMLEQGLEKAYHSGERISEMRLHLHAARLNRARGGDRAATENALARAARMARSAGAVAIELDAVGDLATLLIEDGRPAEARPLLQAALARAPAPAKSRLGRRALALLERAGGD